MTAGYLPSTPSWRPFPSPFGYLWKAPRTSGAVSARHMCRSCQFLLPGATWDGHWHPPSSHWKVLESSCHTVIAPHLIFGTSKLWLQDSLLTETFRSGVVFLSCCNRWNKWRGGSLACFGISSQPCGCQSAVGKGAQIPPGKRNDFLVVLWVAACPERVAGVVAAARCVMGVSGGYAHNFGTAPHAAEELVGVGAGGQVCSKGEV